MSPVGTTDNSPAIYRREEVEEKCRSPVGTIEISAGFNRPYGTSQAAPKLSLNASSASFHSPRLCGEINNDD
jgi:hypothetical protein